MGPHTGVRALVPYLMAGALLLAGCRAAPSVCLTSAEVAAYAPLAPQREVRLLTLNVWSGLTYEGVLRMGRYPDQPRERYAALLSRLRELAPDVIAIQEANPLPAYADRLAADLGYSVVHRVSLGGIRLGPVGVPWNLREGDAVLVKGPWTVTPIARRRLAGAGIVTDWFSFHTGETTQALLCRVIVNGKPLYVYDVHLHSGPSPGPALEEAVREMAAGVSPADVAAAERQVQDDVERRRREAVALASFIWQTLPPGMPAVVMGDFNTPPGSSELAPLLAEGEWLDSFRHANPGAEGSTWDPARNPNIALQTREAAGAYARLSAAYDRQPHRIDLILLSRTIPPERIVESRVVMTAVDGVCPSDHYGVMTALLW